MTAKVFALRSGRRSSQYKLLHLTERSGETQHSRLYYVPRITDLHITPTAFHFPTLLVPDYISNHIDLLHEATMAVEFAWASQKPASLTMDYAAGLLPGLTSRWAIAAAVSAPNVVFRELHKSRFRFPQCISPLAVGLADVSVWQKAGTAKLLVRCNDPTYTDRWTSATLPVGVTVGGQGAVVLLTVEEMTRGSHWDLGTIDTAGNNGEKGTQKAGCEIEIEFSQETEGRAFRTVIQSLGKKQ